MKKNTKTNSANGINDKKKALMGLRLTKAVSGLQKPHEKKVLKKEIARMLSAQNK